MILLALLLALALVLPAHARGGGGRGHSGGHTGGTHGHATAPHSAAPHASKSEHAPPATKCADCPRDHHGRIQRSEQAKTIEAAKMKDKVERE